MKKEDLVKLGLDEATAEKVAGASAEELKGFVPRERLNEATKAKEAAETVVRERDGQLETLKKSTGDVEALKNQIQTLQTENKQKDEAHKAEMKALQIEGAVNAALTAAKAKNAKAVKALLELEKAELDADGNVKGLSEQLEKLKKAEDSKFLFDASNPKLKGAKLGESGNEPEDRGVDTSKMSYDELCAYLAENPEVNLEQ